MLRRNVFYSLVFFALLLSVFLLPRSNVLALTPTVSRTPTRGCGSVVVVTSTPSPTFTPTPRTATATPTSCGVIYITATPSATFTPTADITVTGYVFTQVYDMMVPVSGAVVKAGLNVGRSVSTTTASNGSFSLFLPGAYVVGYGANFTVSATNYVTYTTFYSEAALRANPSLYFTLQPTTPIPSLTPTPIVTPSQTPQPGGLPDLTVLSITEYFIPNAPTPTADARGCWWTPWIGTSTATQVTIQNIGAADAGSFVLSMNDGSQTTINGLAAGQTLTVNLGSTRLRTRIATVDSTSIVVESNENNNVYTLTLTAATSTSTVTPRPTECGTPKVTPTRTPTITLTPTVTVTPSRTLTVSPTPTCGCVPVCSPVTATIAAPFTFDGAGSFCWQSANLGTYINSWNTTSVNINGVNITNLYVPAASYPAKVGGYWYIAYNSSVAWAHLEAK